MKKFLIFLAFLAGSFGTAKAQATVSLPAGSTVSEQLTWPLPGTCTTAKPCTFRTFKIAGSCPATLVGSTGWTQLTDTGSNAVSFVDSNPGSTVDTSGNVSYVVYTLQNTLISVPSNCVTATIPNVPSPVVVTAH